MPGADDATGPAETILHASCVALNGRGLLITGASGSGKSGLALALMSHGATLVADDRVIVRRRGGALLAEPPAPIRGLIEARGVGLLRAAVAAPVRLFAVVAMDRTETERLPPGREATILGAALPEFFNVDSAHFAPALLQYLRAGLRQDG